ncbi:MAG: histidine phosphatase family protein [Vicinamibacterales bacterium]
MTFLIHHAAALPPDVDHMRPLSSLGRGQAERVASAVHARGVRPATIWHSGKLRAKQTAEICWRTLNPLATFAIARGLQPDDDPEVMWAALNAHGDETADRHGAHGVLIAGHMPHLSRLLHRLTTGQRDGATSPFPLHGCVALERVGERWEEKWRVE